LFPIFLLHGIDETQNCPCYFLFLYFVVDVAGVVLLWVSYFLCQWDDFVLHLEYMEIWRGM
jgi:hypothetical protein